MCFLRNFFLNIVQLFDSFYEFFSYELLFRALSPHNRNIDKTNEDFDMFIARMRSRIDQWKSFMGIKLFLY